MRRTWAVVVVLLGLSGLLLVLLLSCGLPPGPIVHILTVDTITSGADTYIDSYNPTTNYSTMASYALTSHTRILIKPDLSGIPVGSTINSATLSFYAAGWSGAGTITATVYAITRTTGYTNTTYDLAQTSPSNAWGTTGCDNTTSDRSSVAAATFVFNNVSKWFTVTLTSLVQNWAGGGFANNGVILVRTAGSVEYTLNSFEASSNKPRWVIDYTAPTATPTDTGGATPTDTLTPTDTPTPTETLTPTETPVPTSTPVVFSTLLHATCDDGWIYGATSSHDAARATSSGCVYNGVTALLIGQLYYPTTYEIYRSFISFDLDSIPDTATDITATLRLCAVADNSATDFTINVYQYNWSAPLCSSREANYDGAFGGGATSLASFASTVSGWVSGTCYYVDLPAGTVGTSGMLSLTLGSSREIADIQPTGAEWVTARDCGFGDTARDPALIVGWQYGPTPTPTLSPTPTDTPTETPTPTNTTTPPTPTPTRTITPTPTASPTAAVPYYYTGLLPRVLWVQDDWARMNWSNPSAYYSWTGTDGFHELKGHPEYGPMGGMEQFSAQLYWSNLNPADGVYNWSYIEQTLQMGQTQLVTLDDGSTIYKPYIFAAPVIVEHIWQGSTCCTDMTPTWVKAVAPSVCTTEPTCLKSGAGNVCPTGGTCPSGYTLGTEQICRPNVEDADWRAAYYKFVAAMGAKFDNNPAYPNFAGVVAGIGLANESQLAKGCTCIRYYSSSDPASYMTTFIPEAMAAFSAAFPHRVVWFSMFAPRTAIQATARTMPNKIIGVKNNGWNSDSFEDEFRYYGLLEGGRIGFSYGRTDTSTTETYRVIPTGNEPGSDIDSTPRVYWLFLNGLAAHDHLWDLQYRDETGNVWKYAYAMKTGYNFDLLRFARDHLARTETNAPSVWTVLRETTNTASSCYPTWQCWQGRLGNLDYYLYELRAAPYSASTLVDHASLVTYVPAEHPYSYKNARKTQQYNGNVYMSFDIDDDWAARSYASQACGGSVTYAVTVTLANRGVDQFALEYKDCNGSLVQRVVTKGAAIGTVNTWVDVVFQLTDAVFNNGLEGGADLRINCMNDNDEIVHRVIVKPHGWTPVPEPTVIIPTPPPSATPTRTPTITPTGTPPTPTPTATGTPPTATPTFTPMDTPTATPTFTATNTPTATPVVTMTPVCPSSVKIYGSHIWASGVYTITCHLGIMEGGSLTLQPGTELRFAPGQRLDVLGSLWAYGDGTAAGAITFTSSTSITMGSWGPIYIDSLQSSVLSEAQVLYGRGVSDASWSGNVIYRTNILTNSYGLVTLGNTLVLSSTLRYNNIGLLMRDDAQPEVMYTNVYESILYNAWNDQRDDVEFYYDWWGVAIPTGMDVLDGVDDPRLGVIYRYENAASLIPW